MNALVLAVITASFPISVHPSGRYLVDAAGVPFPILGMTAWSAAVNLNPTEAATFIRDRTDKGFNSVLIYLTEHRFTSNKPPANYKRALPFLKRLDGAPYSGSPNGTTTPTPAGFAPDPYARARFGVWFGPRTVVKAAPDFTTPNEAYWQAIDWFLLECEKNGLLVFAFPAYLGYHGEEEGWMAEMLANGPERIRSYGEWVAARYKSRKNIVWVLGGDLYPSASGKPSQEEVLNALYLGLASVTGQLSGPHFTAHWVYGPGSPHELATSHPRFAPVMDLNAVYDKTARDCESCLAGYRRTPPMPVFLLEGAYETGAFGDVGEPNRRHGWSYFLCSGSGDGFYGQGSTTTEGWMFLPGWASTLQSQGSKDAARRHAFINSIPWYKLVPSGQAGTKTLITAGAGTSGGQAYDFVPSAAAVDGSLLVAYVPPAHSGTITVDLTAMAGRSRVRWYNPYSGAYSMVGYYEPASATLAPPSDNGSGYEDWLLVADALEKTQGLKAPELPPRRPEH